MGTGLVRVGVAAFVLLWLLGPDWLQETIPIWIVFLVALGLELNFFFGARRAEAARPDRLPQEIDRDRWGYAERRELVLVHRDGEELWIPYAGEEGEDLERLIAVAAPHGGERALDLGCGVGHTLRAASSAARDAFAITPATFAAPKVVIVARRSPISAERR